MQNTRSTWRISIALFPIAFVVFNLNLRYIGTDDTKPSQLPPAESRWLGMRLKVA
jgi:hypothetical protein